MVVTHDTQSGAEGGRPRRDALSPPRLAEGEGQILYDGRPADLTAAATAALTQFILRGEAGERLKEMQNGN